MAVKEPIKADGYRNEFDLIAGGIITTPLVLRQQESDEADVEKLITRVQKRQLLEAERHKIMSEFGKPEEKVEVKVSEAKDTSPKRYLVDTVTGRIDVVDDGEYTYKEAVAMSASIRAAKGEYSEAIKLLQALKEFGGENEEKKEKREWLVEDDGEMIHDPDNGELSFSQARAVSASKQRALALRTEEPVTKDKLDLMKRDMTDEMRKTVVEAVSKVKEDLVPKNSQPAFTIDDEGKIKLNPKASLTVMEYLIWQQSQKPASASNPVILPDGRQMDGAFAIEWTRHTYEQQRKDDLNKAIVGFIGDVRQKLPDVLEAFRNVGRSPQVEESMQRAGWLGNQQEKKVMRTINCPACKTQFSTITPALVTCPNPNCLKLIMVGRGDDDNLDKAFSQSITKQVADEISRQQKEATSASQTESEDSGALSEG
jgi:hypothetical protein